MCVLRNSVREGDSINILFSFFASTFNTIVDKYWLVVIFGHIQTGMHRESFKNQQPTTLEYSSNTTKFNNSRKKRLGSRNWIEQYIFCVETRGSTKHEINHHSIWGRARDVLDISNYVLEFSIWLYTCALSFHFISQ